MRICASLWSVPQPDLTATAERLRDAGLRTLHWDHTDGVFARAGGFDPVHARELTELTRLRAEAHLMVADPLDHVDAWTDFCEIIVVHAEARDWMVAAHRIEARGARPALAISLGTPVATVQSTELAILCMSVTPGEAGSRFNSAALETIASVHAAGRARLLGLDGGVTHRHVRPAVAAGANWLVSGTDLTTSPDPVGWLDKARRGGA